MGTRLEQLQAAAKAAQTSGQKLFNAPISAPQVQTQTPQVSTPAVSAPSAVKTPVAAPKVSTATAPSYATQTEVQRKASLGIPLTNPTNAVNAAAYKSASPPGMKATTAAPQTAVPQTVAQTPTTNYVAQGGQTLNDILYLKKQYESGKTGAAAYATPIYNKLDPQTASMVKGMNASQLEAYITKQSGQAQPTESTAEAPATPLKDYRAIAQAQYDQEQAQMDAAAAAAVKELERRNQYQAGVTRDNRSLEDSSFYRNNAPTAWDGSTGYQASMQDRNRSIADTYTAQGLADAEAAAYSAANTFRNQSGNYLNTKATELENADKQYNLQVAGLTGVLNGQQTMQGAANAAQLVSQNIANQIAQIDLSTYPEQSALKLQQLQQQVQSGKISNDTAAYQFSQLTDPNSPTNQATALDLEMKKIDASNYSETAKLKLEEIRKSIAEIGKTPYQSDADARLDQLRVLTAEAELEKLQQTESKAGTKFEDVQSNIEKIVQRTDEKDKSKITNPTAVEDYILNSDMSPYEMYRAYGAYGLKWEGAVPSKGE